MPISEIMSRDLLESSPLFAGDLPRHAEKATLVSKIEDDMMSKPAWNYQDARAEHVIVDFMSSIRQLHLSDFSLIGDVIIEVVKKAVGICSRISTVHFIFDSYIESSLKEVERLKRSQSIDALAIINTTRDTPIPKQQEKFWATENNQRAL